MSSYDDQLSKFLNADQESQDEEPVGSHDQRAAEAQHPILESMAQGLGRVSDFFRGGSSQQNSPMSKLSAAIPGVLGIDSLGNTLHRFAMGDAHHYDSEERNAALVDYVGAMPVGIGAGGLAKQGLRAALEGSVRADGKAALGMFAGQQSATSDLGALEQARIQKASGKTPEEIHKATGWFQGKDGQWRYEIDDSTSAWKAEQYRKQQRAPEFKAVSTLKAARDLKQEAEAAGVSVDKVIQMHEFNYDTRLPDAVKGLARSESGDKLHEMMMGAYAKFNAPLDAKLGDILQHQRLFEAYPDLKDMPVNFNDLGPNLHGAMNTGPFPKMKLNSRNNYGQEGHSTVLHEVQHQVQHDEGFDPGESEGSLLERSNIKSVDHAMLQDTVQAAIDIRNGNQFFRQANKDAAELADDHTVSTEDLRAHLKFLSENRPKRIDPATAKEMYTASGGEVEARATEKRRRMSQIDRSKSFPMDSYDVPPDKILLRNQR